jgi:hypothetical protein
LNLNSFQVNAVYPTLSQERLVTMTVDQILAHDPRTFPFLFVAYEKLTLSLKPGVSEILGVTKKIVSRNSKAFAEEIGKYIDSKEARGKKNKKDKKDDGKSLMDKVREAAGQSKKKDKADANAPAFWPLIRQVNVRCNAACLSTGAILVDLPGSYEVLNFGTGIFLIEFFRCCRCQRRSC